MEVWNLTQVVNSENDYFIYTYEIVQNTVICHMNA